MVKYRYCMSKGKGVIVKKQIVYRHGESSIPQHYHFGGGGGRGGDITICPNHLIQKHIQLNLP